MSNNFCKMFYILDKNVQMPFIMVNHVPIFYQDGKVYYIYKDFPIGSYLPPDVQEQNGFCYNVFDNCGHPVGWINWDDKDQGWTKGHLFCNEPFKENARKNRLYGNTGDGVADDRIIITGAAYALTNAIYADSSWNEEVALISTLGQKDTWGATAAYICLQNYDPVAKEALFYNVL